MRSANDKLRIVIADDQRRARSFLTAILRNFDDVEVVAEAVNGTDAVALIESKRPDLALLDLHMPELDGCGVVRILKKNRTPLVTFVTAFDEYAVQTFEANSLDYILKPVKAFFLHSRQRTRILLSVRRKTRRRLNLTIFLQKEVTMGRI